MNHYYQVVSLDAKGRVASVVGDYATRAEADYFCRELIVNHQTTHAVVAKTIGV